jgi:PAS domain S-box-containing protein
VSETGHRILVVEDQRIIAADLASTLKKLGYSVVGTAATGDDAVARACELGPELVLMDVRLRGEMDGIEAAAAIRRRADIPVVYLTAYADAETIARARLTTPFGFVVKPFDERELCAAIEIALYKHQTDRELAEERARRQVAEESQRALSASEEQFRSAVIHAPVPMMLHADDGEVLAVSEAVIEGTGYSRESIRTLDDWIQLAYGERAAEIRTIVERAFEGDPPPPTELPVNTASGEIKQWLFSVSDPLQMAGDRRVIVVVGVDVTRQRQAEGALQESHRQKDEFIAMLGHELRNPLAAVRSATELLKLVARGDPRFQRTQDVLERQTGHMAKLIDGLLDVSRIVSGRISIEREMVDLRGILDEAIQDRLAPVESRGLELRTQLARGPLWVRGDRVRLAQIIDNMLSNAMKFTERPGSITVAARREGDEVVVDIQDTGAGIDAELLPHIFEPFRQAEQSLSRASGGLGLGLAVVKGMVEMHGGQVAATSAGPGRGAELSVRLPLAEAPDQHPEPALEHTGPARVLIVEDNEDAAETLRIVLETKGNEVEVAYDGESALEAATSFGPEIVLCDIGLPGGMNGYDVARTLRDRGQSAFLVAVTGYGRPEDVRRATDAGFDAHLTKPIEVAKIEDLIAHRSSAARQRPSA